MVGLAETLPDWEGCQKLLQGEAVRPKGWRPPRARATPGSLASSGKSLLQLLREYDERAVAAPARQVVLDAQVRDVGGLMQAHHLRQINRGAECLGRWLAAAVTRLREAPAAVPAPEAAALQSALFTVAPQACCPTCGKPIPAEMMEEHRALCLARERAREGREWGQQMHQEMAAAAAAAAAAAVQDGVDRGQVHSIKPLLEHSQVPSSSPLKAPTPRTRPLTPPPAAAPPLKASPPKPPAQPVPTPPQPVEPAAVPAAARPMGRERPLLARPNPPPRPLYGGADGGYDYLRSRSGFAGALPPRRAERAQGRTQSSVSPREGRRDEEVPQIFSRDDHMKAIRAKLAASPLEGPLAGTHRRPT